MSNFNNIVKDENLLELAEEAGLVFSGRNFEGQPEFIGSVAQWNEFTKLQNKQ